ncbi:MAG: glutathione S-transferase N-terminal domain-containing protein [Bdellovibrionota bacterium]
MTQATPQTAKSPKLYQYEVCPFCWKARVALSLKKAPYEKVEVHPLNKKEIAFSDGYKKVPIYVDSVGAQVNDSNEIMKHIDKEFADGPKLFADENSEEAKELQKWLDWSETYVKAVPPLIYDNLPNALKAFDYITKVGNFSTLQKMTIKYSGAFVMKMVAKKSKERQNIEDPAEHILVKMNEWTAALGGNPFRGGATPDASDAAVFGITLSMKGLPAYELTQKNPEFYAWMKRMSEQSGIAA